MGNLRRAIQGNKWFGIFSIAAIFLIVVSFFTPPLFVIDGSVIAAVGELFGFAALGSVIKAIDAGADAKITHNNTTIEFDNPDD